MKYNKLTIKKDYVDEGRSISKNFDTEVDRVLNNNNLDRHASMSSHVLTTQNSISSKPFLNSKLSSRRQSYKSNQLINKLVRERIEDLSSNNLSRIHERDDDYDSQKSENDDDMEYNTMIKANVENALGGLARSYRNRVK